MVESLKSAWQAYLAGEFEEAKDEVDRHLRNKPDDAVALSLKCFCLIGMSDFENAKATCERIKDIEGASFHYHRTMGAIITDDPSTTHDWVSIRRAIQHMEEALELAPASVKGDSRELSGLLYNLANARHRRFRHKREIQNVQAGVLLSAFRETLETFNEALGQDHSNVEAWVNKGNLLDEAGRYAESIQCYREALRRQPNHDMALGNYALALSNMGLHLPSRYRQICLLEAGYFFRVALDRAEFRTRYESDPKLKNMVDQIVRVDTFDGANDVVSHLLDHMREEKQLPNVLGSLRTDNFPQMVMSVAGSLGIQLGFTDAEVLRNVSPEDWVDLPSFLGRGVVRREASRAFLTSLFHRYRTALSLFVLAYTDIHEFRSEAAVSATSPSRYSLHTEILKESAKISVDILDSIAHFLADWGGYHQKRVNFSGSNSIFTKTSIMTDMRSSQYLFALASLSNDLSQGMYAELDDVRNSITHEYFLIWSPEKASPAELEIPKDHHASLEDFHGLAVRSLGISRAAILYLVLFILEGDKRPETADFKAS